MKKVFCSFILCFTLCTSIQANAFAKNKVAVLDFQVQGEQAQDKDLGKIVSEWLITTLVKDGRFELVERRLLDKILAEQKLELTGLVSSSDISAIGNLLKADSIIIGTINSLAGEFSINARIIEVKHGTIIKAEQAKAINLHDLERAAGELTGKLTNNFPLLGYVVKGDGEKILIDLGIENGIKMGMVFQVYGAGEIIMHPKTNEIIGQERVDKGEIVINKVRDHLSEAHISRQAPGRSIKSGDRVETIKDLPQSKTASILGMWEAFHSDDARSSFESGPKKSIIWHYAIDTVGDETYAGINLQANSFSIKDKTIILDMDSPQGMPLWFRLLSFVDGYSKQDDEDTFVPAEILLILQKGHQTLTINPEHLQIPQWWLEENRVKGNINFAPDNVIGLDLEAEFDDELGEAFKATSDTVTIYGISIK